MRLVKVLKDCHLMRIKESDNIEKIENKIVNTVLLKSGCYYPEDVITDLSRYYNVVDFLCNFQVGSCDSIYYSAKHLNILKEANWIPSTYIVLTQNL